MLNLQAVFWDFDGVVLDSVNVKTRAFARMFRKFGPEIENAVIDYHLSHGGISRFEKFKYYYNHLMFRAISDAELKELGDEFSRLVVEEVLASPFIPGALETLNEQLKRKIPAFVVSGTPEAEVQYIVQKKELSHYFYEVHGSPRTKADILYDIICRKKFNKDSCLFLGDAMTDYDAAMSVGIPFIGIIHDPKESCFPVGTNTMQSISLLSK